MKFEGIITPLVTPFNEQQEINYDATEQLIEHLIAHGVKGLFILGSNGEFHVMEDEEKVTFAKFVIEKTNHRVPVYVGTGGNSTASVIRLSKQMEALGADALSVITPYFIAPKEQELITHYKMIAEAVHLPIILYNIPKSTGINLSYEVVRELAAVKNIVAIKDSSGNMDNMKDYLKAANGNEFEVLVGSDSKMLEAFKMGATAAVAGTSNLLTDIDVAVYDNFKKGDLEKAAYYQNEIEPLRDVLKLGTVPSVLKKAVHLMGIPVGPARYPVCDLSEESVDKIKAMLSYYHM
ncbi:4-hydroxy-tetrahydrodipicolinate synthase [Amedibacillus sp. YH-ame10]